MVAGNVDLLWHQNVIRMIVLNASSSFFSLLIASLSVLEVVEGVGSMSHGARSVRKNNSGQIQNPEDGGKREA